MKAMHWAMAAAMLAPGNAQAQAADDAARKAELVTANRILADQGVVDGFGHVSVRSAADPGHFFISRSQAPELVALADLVEVDSLSCEAVSPGAPKLYLERFIHCAVYRARPEVQAVVHNHSPALIPFGVTGQPLLPVYHVAGFLGAGAPRFEIRDVAGSATDMLIRTPALGTAVAKTVGAAPILVMRGHGATVVGLSLRQAVYRAVYAERDAALQTEAMRMGKVNYLSPQEALAAATTNDGQLDRPWQVWEAHLKGN